jgi:transposase
MLSCVKLARSRLTRTQIEKLLEHFVAGTPARPAAALASVNRNTSNAFYRRLRALIARRLALLSPPQSQFGLLEQDGAVRVLVDPAAGVRCDALVRMRERRVVRASDLTLEAQARNPRIDEFWRKLQQLLRRYNGMPHAQFHLFLAECEWRLRCGGPRRCLHALRHWLSRI